MHAWTNLATISSNRGQFDRALEEYDMALELNPTDFECRYNRAVTLSEVTIFDHGLETLCDTSQVEPRAEIPHEVQLDRKHGTTFAESSYTHVFVHPCTGSKDQSIL